MHIRLVVVCVSILTLLVGYLLIDGRTLFQYEYTEPPLYVADWSDWQPANDAVTAETSANTIHIITNVSQYDFQLVSEAIPVTPDTSYSVDFSLAVSVGGAGLHIVGKDNRVLASAYFCQPFPESQQFRVEFSVADESQVWIALSNCASVAPATSSYEVQALQILQVTNYSPAFPPLSQSIAAEYPQFSDSVLTDWEKVTLLREWAYKHIDRSDEAYLLERTSLRSVFSMDAPALFQSFAQDLGGAWCGLSALSLMRQRQNPVEPE